MNFYPFFPTSLPPLFPLSLSLARQGLRGAQIHSGCRGSRADANRIVLTFNIFIFILNIFTDRNSMDAPLATPSYSTPCAQSPVPLDPHLICQIRPAWLQTKTVHHPPPPSLPCLSSYACSAAFPLLPLLLFLASPFILLLSTPLLTAACKQAEKKSPVWPHKQRHLPQTQAQSEGGRGKETRKE